MAGRADRQNRQIRHIGLLDVFSRLPLVAGGFPRGRSFGRGQASADQIAVNEQRAAAKPRTTIHASVSEVLPSPERRW
jgi:hypothetical protein